MSHDWLDKLEVEMKFPVADFHRLRQTLEHLGVIVGPAMEQSDHYFNHPARDFAATDEALRIRRVGPSCYLTYKGPKIDDTTKTRREIEIPLAHPRESHAHLAVEGPARDLFAALGFRPVLTVHKRRRTAHLLWESAEFEIVLDEVDGLGTYVELETLADAQSLDARRQSLQRLAKALGLKQSERRSYLEMLLELLPRRGESEDTKKT